MAIELGPWKDVPGYEGRYQACPQGFIRSLDRVVAGKSRTGTPFKRRMQGKLLSPGRYCKSGHVSVVLGRKTAGKPVHQLIMLTFNGSTPEGLEIRHKNGNPTDNRLSNLEFGTRTQNILDTYKDGGTWRKLSTKEVQTIRQKIASGETGADIARSFDVSQTAISNIKIGRTFSWLK